MDRLDEELVEHLRKESASSRAAQGRFGLIGIVVGTADRIVSIIDRLTADLAEMTAENLALIAKMGEQAGKLAAMTAERDAMRERAEAAERDLSNAQPCFACKSFERNGGPCLGAGRCRVAAVRSIICNVPYDNTSEWEWRGPKEEPHGSA